jgi:hypothetical protein
LQIVHTGLFGFSAVDKAYDDMPPQVAPKKGPPQPLDAKAQKRVAKITLGGTIVFLIMEIIYLFIIILLSRGAKAAFAGQGGLAPDDGDRYTPPRETGYETYDAPDDRFRN